MLERGDVVVRPLDGVISSGPRVRCFAIEESLLHLVDRERMEAWLRDPALAANLVRVLSDQIADRELAVAIALEPRVERRVLLKLRQLADRWGRVTPDGIRLDLRLTHQELANMVGAVRESVTIALGRLADAGEIEMRRRHLIIRPPRDEQERTRLGGVAWRPPGGTRGTPRTPTAWLGGAVGRVELDHRPLRPHRGAVRRPGRGGWAGGALREGLRLEVEGPAAERRAEPGLVQQPPPAHQIGAAGALGGQHRREPRSRHEPCRGGPRLRRTRSCATIAPATATTTSGNTWAASTRTTVAPVASSIHRGRTGSASRIARRTARPPHRHHSTSTAAANPIPAARRPAPPRPAIVAMPAAATSRDTPATRSSNTAGARGFMRPGSAPPEQHHIPRDSRPQRPQNKRKGHPRPPSVAAKPLKQEEGPHQRTWRPTTTPKARGMSTPRKTGHDSLGL